MKSVRGGVVLSAAFLILSVCAGGYGTKIVYHGWDLGLATPDEVLKRASDIDALPVSGITLGLRRLTQSDGTVINAETITTDLPWRRDTLQETIETYKSITSYKNLRHSFVVCSSQPRHKKRFAWDDDAAWARIAGNFRELAYAAKAGGLKGILIDNEDYHGTRQFRYDAARDGDYDATVARVRARGREIFGAIFKEFPDITLLFFWAFIDNEYAHVSADPQATLRASGRLTCAFLDGMLDVIPPQAVFIEGNENAYSYEAYRGDFDRVAVEVLSHMVSVVAPENRAKYRALVRYSFGLYLDEYTIGPLRMSGKLKGQPNHWYRGPRNGSRAEHFRENLEAAARAADEYVWLYGEKFSLIDWGDDGLDQTRWSLRFNQRRTWQDMIGLNDKLSLLINGEKYFKERLKEITAQGKAPNLLGDKGDFVIENTEGKSVTKSFSLIDMTNRVPYALSARVRGDVRVAAYWVRDGKWCWDIPPIWFVEATSEKADDDGWRQVSALVRGPSDVDALIVQFTAKSERGEVRDASLRSFDTDAPAGRLVSGAQAPSAARILSNEKMKALFDTYPKLWRIDGDLIVFQNMVFSEQVIKLDKDLSKGVR
ncbi:MAG: hypothetical protein J6R80_03005 [Kiritimatiellae bacterium]|nr:hypothetical protein [Kiritimatiellia bacterium]